MELTDVPREPNCTLDGERKVVYAQDDNGRYVAVACDGWEVEEIVTTLAVEDFRRRAEEARERVLNGVSAPLEFHIYDRRMDVPTLAAATGLPRWRIRRHLKPAVFARLPPALLSRYVEALGVDAKQLVTLPVR